MNARKKGTCREQRHDAKRRTVKRLGTHLTALRHHQTALRYPPKKPDSARDCARFPQGTHLQGGTCTHLNSIAFWRSLYPNVQQRSASLNRT